MTGSSPAGLCEYPNRAFPHDLPGALSPICFSDLRSESGARRDGCNDTAGNLRLVPGSPELQVQTTDTQGNPVQSERLERLYVESTSLEGMILPGSTVYYALVYKAPIIGINQRVRVLVSHREAADSPVAASLSAVDQGKE